MSSSNSKIVVFAYGSNMLSAEIKEWAPSSTVVGVGKLAGFELSWNKLSKKDRSGKCNVSRTNNPNHVVWGVLFRMSATDKRNLDRKEGLGLPSGYKECAVEVSTPGGQMQATIYYSTHIGADLKPYTWYRDKVIAGAREHGLPEEYIRNLVRVSAMSNPDPG